MTLLASLGNMVLTYYCSSSKRYPSKMNGICGEPNISLSTSAFSETTVKNECGHRHNGACHSGCGWKLRRTFIVLKTQLNPKSPFPVVNQRTRGDFRASNPNSKSASIKRTMTHLEQSRAIITSLRKRSCYREENS